MSHQKSGLFLQSRGISQGSLGKQNQDVCVCVYQEVYFKELTDVIVGAGKSEIYIAGLHRK